MLLNQVNRFLDFIFLLVVSNLPTYFSIEAFSGDTYSGEFCQWKNFNATCPEGHVIVMQYARYGRFRVGKCLRQDYGVVGCASDVLTLVDSRCSGRTECSFGVSEIALTGVQPCPQEFTSYMEAGYRCIPAQPIFTERCSSSDTYHVTYEGNYLSNAATVTDRTVSLHSGCRLILKAEHGQKINITLFYFSVTIDDDSNHDRSSITCRRLASARDTISGKHDNICSSSKRVRSVFISDSHLVELTISPQPQDSSLYFLLKYEAIGCATPSFAGTHVFINENLADVFCNSSGEHWQLQCTGRSWSGAVGNCPVNEDDAKALFFSNLSQNWSTPTGLAAVVGLGVILGVITGLSMLSIAVCIMKYRVASVQRKRRLELHSRYSVTTEADLDRSAFPLPYGCSMTSYKQCSNPADGPLDQQQAMSRTLPSHRVDSCCSNASVIKTPLKTQLPKIVGCKTTYPSCCEHNSDFCEHLMPCIYESPNFKHRQEAVNST